MIDQEVGLAQQQMQDVIAMQTTKMAEGLDEEYAELEELEVVEALDRYQKDDSTVKDNSKQPATYRKLDQKDYDVLVDDLLR